MAGGSIARVIGYGSLVSVVLGGLDFSGGTFRGWRNDPHEDEFERKERMRLNRRRPLSETIEELGEGRCQFYRHDILPSVFANGNSDTPTGIRGTAAKAA